jgi:hypothetical protein
MPIQATISGPLAVTPNSGELALATNCWSNRLAGLEVSPKIVGHAQGVSDTVKLDMLLSAVLPELSRQVHVSALTVEPSGDER